MVPFSLFVKEPVVLASGKWPFISLYCCGHRWRPNQVVTHDHNTQHVFNMDENNPVELTTSYIVGTESVIFPRII